MINGKKLAIAFVAAALIAFCVSSQAAQSKKGGSYILATATPGGTFYPVGVAIASLTKIKLRPKTGISLSAISTAGSGENIKLLRENQAQFAILQGLFSAWAWTGTGKMAHAGKQKQLRAITALWPNVEHYVVRGTYVKTGTMADLKSLEGHKFSIGRRNSGTEGSGTTILTNLGYHPKKQFNLVHEGYKSTTNALQNGLIAGMNTPGGVPVSAVTRAKAAVSNAEILNFTPKELAKVNSHFKLWSRYTIPANTYPNQPKAIHTIAQPNVLVVNANISKHVVYEITKAIYNNLPFLHSVHAATKAIKLQHALDGLTMPLHPGAVEFYRQKGIKIPKRLLPKSG